MDNQSNHTTECYGQKSTEVYKLCAYTRPVMTVELCLCFAGMLNTAVMALVFTRPHMRKSSMNFLLAALEVANFITMLTRLPSTSIRTFCPDILPGTAASVLIEVTNTLYKPTILFANFLTPAIGFWRLVAVTWPIKARLILTRKLGRNFMIGVAIPSLAVSIYIFVFRNGERHNYTSFDEQTNRCYILPEIKDTNQTGCTQTGKVQRNVYLTFSVIISALPCVVSIIVNSCLIGGLISKTICRKPLTEGQNRPKSIAGEAKTTIVLVVFLTAHVICYVCPDLFTLIVYTCPQMSLESRGYFCPLFYHFPAFIYLSFLSLVCYCLMSGRFRNTLCDMLMIQDCMKKINVKIFLRKTSKIQETKL